MRRTVTKSIAIIGEGETEQFYFDSLRVACRYPFKVAPDFPQHSDINRKNSKINFTNISLFQTKIEYIYKLYI